MGCILKHWDKFDPQTLKKKQLIFFFNVAWPQFQLPDQETWPLHGTLSYKIIFQLDSFFFLSQPGKMVRGLICPSLYDPLSKLGSGSIRECLIRTCTKDGTKKIKIFFRENCVREAL